VSIFASAWGQTVHMAHERGAYGLSANVGVIPSDAVHVRAVVVVLSIGFVVAVCASGRSA
jgi:hypothetical protein